MAAAAEALDLAASKRALMTGTLTSAVTGDAGAEYRAGEIPVDKTGVATTRCGWLSANPMSRGAFDAPTTLATPNMATSTAHHCQLLCAFTRRTSRICATR